MKLPPILRALRPHQWTKNVFVLAALGFAAGDRVAPTPIDGGDVVHTLLAFGAFCLAASAIYIVNDLVDLERDRLHPEKRHRPLAAGELSIASARVLAVACGLLALVLARAAGGEEGGGFFGFGVLGVVSAYVVMNLGYSFRLKRVVLVDVFCIATGFLLRVQAGGLAAQAELSHWLLLCTFFLALFLALNKRRAEIDTLGELRAEHRVNLREYTPALLDQLITVLAACTIICYAMYTVDPETVAKFGLSESPGGNGLVWSVPLVVFGVARYMFLVQTCRGGGSPTRVLLGGEAWILSDVAVWIALVGTVVLSGS